MNETITPKELQSLQESRRNLTILDVRRKSDYDVDPKRITGAIWRNPEAVEQWRDEFTDQEVILYCVRGGPAGQIAVMHRELVDHRKWVEESVFLRALNFCMLLPGPEAQQLATYIGLRMHGYLGGVVAGTFFVIPSIFVMLVLSWLAAAHGDVPVIAGLFYGISPVVVAIVVEAVMRIRSPRAIDYSPCQ